MKSIKGLKNPDFVEINGEKFQVIKNTSLWYHAGREELEMVVELIKAGEKQMSPSYRLTYIYERPDVRRFFIFDKASEEFKEQRIISVKF